MKKYDCFIVYFNTLQTIAVEFLTRIYRNIFNRMHCMYAVLQFTFISVHLPGRFVHHCMYCGHLIIFGNFYLVIVVFNNCIYLPHPCIHEHIHPPIHERPLYIKPFCVRPFVFVQLYLTIFINEKRHINPQPPLMHT